MTEESQLVLQETEDQMTKAIQHLDKELHKLRTGKASPQMLEGIRINYYGVMTPIEQTANINTPDARQIIVQPWDKSILSDIDKAIQAANIGINPVDMGGIIRCPLPDLTAQRRQELAKIAHKYAEEGKVRVRNARGRDLRSLVAIIGEEALSAADKAVLAFAAASS